MTTAPRDYCGPVTTTITPQPCRPDLTLPASLRYMPEYSWSSELLPVVQNLWNWVPITSCHGLFGSQGLVLILAHFLSKSFHPPGLSLRI